MKKFLWLALLSTIFFSASLAGQTEDLAGHWKNEYGVGANWGQYMDEVWFISISSRWKELFQGEVDADNKIRGRLVKINLRTWERTELQLEMDNSGYEEITVLTSMPKDGSFSAGRKFKRLGFYSFYENHPNPIFDDKHRAWEVKSWFQDGDTVATVFYDFGHKTHFEKAIFVRSDSLLSLRRLSSYHNTCYTREVLHYKLEKSGIIRVKMKDIDGTCEHDLEYARGASIEDRYEPNGHLPLLVRWQPIDYREVECPPSFKNTLSKSFIQAIKIEGKLICADSCISEIKIVEVPFGKTVEFQIFNPGFLYQLDGYDPDWYPVPENNTVRYASLPPGDYTFRIAPDPKNSERSRFSDEKKLRVAPPFYLTAWLWVMVGMIGALGILAVYWIRGRWRRRRDELRRHIARELHDDIGSTLSSISMLAKVAGRIDRERSAPQLDAIGKKAREALDNISDIVWAMNPRHVTTEEMLQRMKEFAIETLDPQEVKVQFTAEDQWLSVVLRPEQRNDFYLLFKEAVNNAAKYSAASDVWISVQSANGSLCLEIRDNGRGFDPALVKRGNGLGNMQRRAERLGGELRIESTPDEGTMVRVNCRLQNFQN